MHLSLCLDLLRLDLLCLLYLDLRLNETSCKCGSFCSNYCILGCLLLHMISSLSSLLGGLGSGQISSYT